MFRLFVVVVFLFSFVSLVVEANELGVEESDFDVQMEEPLPAGGAEPYTLPSTVDFGEDQSEEVPAHEITHDIQTQGIEIDPDPIPYTPEEEEGDIPIPIPRPVDEQGIEMDPEPFTHTPEDEEGSMPIPLPEPVGEEYDRELDPEPMF